MRVAIKSAAVTSNVAVSFAAPVNYTGGPNWDPFQFDIRSIATVDLNGDGFLDIFVHPSYAVYGPVLSPLVLLNDRKGGFTNGTAAVFPVLPVVEQSNGVFFRDFNNDGRLDMFVVDQGLEIGNASVGGFKGAINRFYIQGADGKFTDASANIPSNIASFNHISTVTDINADGNLDVLVTRLGGPALEGSGTFFYLGNGQGGFSFSTAGLPEEIKYLTATQRNGKLKTVDYQFSGTAGAGDLNNDGRQDLVTGSYVGGDSMGGTQTVRVFEQGANGAFAIKWQTGMPSAVAALGTMGVAGISMADLDGDGLRDIVVQWEGSGFGVQILRNTGNFTFSDVTTAWLGSYLVRNQQLDSAGNFPAVTMQVQLVDANLDGKTDMVLHQIASSAAQFTAGMSSGAFVYLNDGTGHLSAAIPTVNGASITADQMVAMTGNPSYAQGVPLAFDANNDGVLDYVFLGAENGSIRTTTPAQITNLHIATLLGAPANVFELAGKASNDAVQGTAAIDTAIFGGARANYTIAKAAGGYTVTDKTGAEGMDTLTGIERLQFSDARIAIDISGNGGMAYRLYQAAFNRTPDQGGLGYQMNALDKGLNIAQVAANFIASPEFSATYGSLNDTQYVTQLYQNVLHRGPDAGGLSFHTGNLASGANTRANVLVGFSESPENQAALMGVIENGMVYST